MTPSPSVIERRVCVEQRVEDSDQPHFNRVGDWRPRLIVWPVYNGLPKDEFEETVGEPIDEATDEKWGIIIAETLRKFTAGGGYCVVAFELTLRNVWKRMTLRNATPYWMRNELFRLDAQYVNSRQHFGHDSHVFLVTTAEMAASMPREFGDTALHRGNLLQYGVAIFDLGIEEAVLEIAFSEHENRFLQILDRVAGEQGHQMVHTDKHFLSHWVVANKAQFGPEWDRF